MNSGNGSETLSQIGGIAAIMMGLYLSSLYGYILFHSLVEIMTVAIGFTLFILTWNTRGVLKNNYLNLLGIGYAFIAIIDLFHTLAYKGMNVFPGFGANLPTQLWIAARYLQAVTLCVAPCLMERSVGRRAIFAGYAAAVSVLVAMVYSGNFPDCFIEGKGLTTFKVGSEYVISALLLLSSYLLYRKRRYFSDRVFFLIFSSIACAIVSGIWFTAYLNVYDVANMVGHYFKLASFYLLYRALLVTGLREPFNLVFRELRQAQEAIRTAHDNLEEQIRERTAELRASEEKYRALIESANDAVFVHEISEDGIPGPFFEVNELASRQLGYSREELTGMCPMDLEDPNYRRRIREAMERLLGDGHAVYEAGYLSKDGRSVPVEVSTRVIEIRGKRLIFSLSRDITERKWMEAELETERVRLKTLIQTIPDPVWLKDPNGVFLVSNAAFARLYDTTEAGLIGKTDYDYVDPELAAFFQRMDQEAIAAGRMRMNEEWVTFAGDGHRELWETIKTPLYDAMGEVVGVLGIARDITQRKRMEEILHKREQDFRTLVENAPDNIVRYDTECRIIYVNPRHVRTVGIPADAMLGKTITELFPGEKFREYHEKIKQVIATGEEIAIDYVLSDTIDGGQYHCVRFAPELGPEGNVSGVLAIGRDITELKKTGRLLRESHAQMRQFLQTIPDLVWLKDSNGVYIACNVAFERFFGSREADIVGKTDYDFVDVELADFFREKDREAISAGSILINEEWVTYKDDGRRRLLETRKVPVFGTDNKLIGVLGIARDVSKRKESEIALQESEARYRALFEESIDGVFISSIEGKLIDISKTGVRIFGYDTKEEMKRLDLARDVFSNLEDRNRLLSEIDLKGTGEFEVAVRKKNGETMLIRCSMAAVRNMDGNVIGYQGVIRDITEERRLEQELFKAKKMEIIGQLAGGVAHEVRNPLNAILSISEALFREKEIAENPEFFPYVQHIRTQVGRLSKLMTDLLDLGKPIRPGSIQSVPLNEVVTVTSNLWSLMEGAATHPMVFTCDDMSRGLMVNADSARLQQALLNLLENASQHSPAGSEICLHIGKPDRQRVTLQVRDSGKGIVPEKLSKVFDPFFTTRPGGTGLGLPLVKHFVESMGGEVRIRNHEQPPGCTAELVLNIVTDERGSL